MASRGAGRWDVGQVRLLDGNPEARRDVAAHHMVAHQDELEIFGLAKEDRRQVAVFLNPFPNLFLKPTRAFPMAKQRQDVVHQERPAGRVRLAAVKLLDAAQMAQLQVLQGPQEQPSQEPRRVSQQRVPDQMDELQDEHLALRTPAQVWKALPQGVPPGFRGSHWVPRASLPQQAQHLPASPQASRQMAQAERWPPDARRASSPQSPLPASPLRPQLPSPPALQNAFAQAPRVRGRASSNASSSP